MNLRFNIYYHRRRLRPLLHPLHRSLLLLRAGLLPPHLPLLQPLPHPRLLRHHRFLRISLISWCRHFCPEEKIEKNSDLVRRATSLLKKSIFNSTLTNQWFASREPSITKLCNYHSFIITSCLEIEKKQYISLKKNSPINCWINKGKYLQATKSNRYILIANGHVFFPFQSFFFTTLISCPALVSSQGLSSLSGCCLTRVVGRRKTRGCAHDTTPSSQPWGLTSLPPSPIPRFEPETFFFHLLCSCPNPTPSIKVLPPNGCFFVVGSGRRRFLDPRIHASLHGLPPN